MRIKQINRYEMKNGEVAEPPEEFHGKSVVLVEIPGVTVNEDHIGIETADGRYYEIWFEEATPEVARGDIQGRYNEYQEAGA